MKRVFTMLHPEFLWYAARDSNPQALRRWDLNPMRLPIPPAAYYNYMLNIARKLQKNKLFSLEKIFLQTILLPVQKNGDFLT